MRKGELQRPVHLSVAIAGRVDSHTWRSRHTSDFLPRVLLGQTRYTDTLRFESARSLPSIGGAPLLLDRMPPCDLYIEVQREGPLPFIPLKTAGSQNRGVHKVHYLLV